MVDIKPLLDMLKPRFSDYENQVYELIWSVEIEK